MIRRILTTSCFVALLVSLLLVLLVSNTEGRDRQLGNAGRQLLSLAYQLQLPAQGGRNVASLDSREMLEISQQHVATIAANKRGVVAAHRAAIALAAGSVVSAWQAYQTNADRASVTSPTLSSAQSAMPQAHLTELSRQYQALFDSVTEASLSTQVLRELGELGAAVGYFSRLSALRAAGTASGLDHEVVAAYATLIQTIEPIHARAGESGALRGYRVREALAGFVGAVGASDPGHSAVGAGLSKMPTQQLPETPLSDLTVLLEQYNRLLGGAAHLQRQIRLLGAILACACLLILSMLGWRAWRHSTIALKMAAADKIEIEQLKSSWVEHASAITAGDCTYRWRATDGANLKIADALNGTTDTICQLVGAQHNLAGRIDSFATTLDESRQHRASLHRDRSAAMSELASVLTDSLEAVNQPQNWVETLNEVLGMIRTQAKTVAMQHGFEQQNERASVETRYPQTLLKMAAVENALESAADRIVGVRQAADAGKMLTLNASLKVAAEADPSPSLANQAHALTQRTELEITRIEKMVRTASDDLHASIALLTSEDAALHVVETSGADANAADTLAPVLTQLSTVCADINAVADQCARRADEVTRLLVLVESINDAEQHGAENEAVITDSARRLAAEVRHSVSHYVMPGLEGE